MTRILQYSMAAMAAVVAVVYYRQGTRVNAAALERVEAFFDALDGTGDVPVHGDAFHRRRENPT